MRSNRSLWGSCFFLLVGCGGGTPAPHDDAGIALVDAATSPDLAEAPDPRDAPGVFSAVGNHVHHMRSTDDGVTWTDEATDYQPGDPGDAYGIRTVVWGNHEFVAFADKLLTSADGVIFTDVPRSPGQWMASMIFAQSQWVSSGGYGWLATTTGDLGNWVTHSPVPDYTAAHHSRQALAYGKVWGKDAWVVTDDLFAVYRSEDGQTWLPTTGAPVVDANSSWGTVFAFGHNVFVGMLPWGSGIIRSTDAGATWTTSNPLPAGAVGLVYAQGHFTALGTGHVYTSVDGATWADHVDASAQAGDLTYGHGTYIGLVGPSSNLYRSTDGISYTQVHDNAGNVDGISAVAFGTP